MSPAGYAPLLRGSFWLTVNLAVTTATGLAFWLLTARLYDRQVFGLASSLFSSVAFVNYATSMGLPTMVVRYSDEGSPRWRALFGWGLAISALTSVVGATAYLAIVDFPGGRAIGGIGLAGGMVLAAAVVGVSISSLIDLRLIAARRWHAVVSKSALIGLGRMALLFVPLHRSAPVSVFIASVGPYFVAAAAIIVFWSLPARAALAIRPIPRQIGGVLRFSVVNYFASLASGAAFFALPVIVLSNVSPDANATFYVGWTAASVVFLVPAAIGQSLLVEGSRGGGRFGRQALLGLALSACFMTIALVVLIIAPGLLSTVFGSTYGTSGAILASLCLAGLPWAVTSIALSVARVHHQHLATLAITVTLGAVVLPLAALLTPRQGIGGATEAWLLGHLCAAGVALGYLLAGPGNLPSRVRHQARRTEVPPPSGAG